MLTSNKHVRDWPEIFAGDEIITTAILDRLLHHVAIVHIDGRSYRLRDLDALLSPAAESAATTSGRCSSPVARLSAPLSDDRHPGGGTMTPGKEDLTLIQSAGRVREFACSPRA